MAEFTEKYIHPFTDYGFKSILGEEPNTALFAGISFLLPSPLDYDEAT